MNKRAADENEVFRMIVSAFYDTLNARKSPLYWMIDAYHQLLFTFLMRREIWISHGYQIIRA